MSKQRSLKIGLFIFFLVALLFWILQGKAPPKFEGSSWQPEKVALEKQRPESDLPEEALKPEPTEVQKSFLACFQEATPTNIEPQVLLKSLRNLADIEKKSLHFKNSHAGAQRILVQRKEGETSRPDYELRFFGVDSENLPIPLPKLFETVEKHRIKDRVESLATEFGEISYLEEEYNWQLERYQIKALYINEKLTELTLRTLEKSLLCSENGCQCL